MNNHMIGHFTIVVESAVFTRNTNIVNKMNPYVWIKQSKDKSKKERRIYRGKKIIAKTPACPKGHKTPVWKCRVKLPDYLTYVPKYNFKAMNKTSLLGDEEIGRWVVDLTEIRDIKALQKVNYEIYFDRRPSGTICLSFKYTDHLKEDNPQPSISEVEESKQFEEFPPAETFIKKDGEQEYDEYIPTDQNEDADSSNSESKSSDEDFKTVAERNRAYHKRFLYFTPKSSTIYEYERALKGFKEISKQSEVLHPSEVQATELPDQSYLLSGGRDAATNEFTQTVVHYFNDQYFRRADMPTPRVEHSTIYLKGFVYCFGGYNEEGVLKSIQAHDMNNDVWIDCSELVVARYRTSVWKFDETLVYLFGGCSSFDVDPFTSTIERFNAENATSELLDVKLPKEAAGSVCLQKNDSSILVLGGYKFSPRKKWFEFNITDLTWKTIDDLNEETWSIHPPQINCNKIIIFGSEHSSEDPPKVTQHDFDFM